MLAESCCTHTHELDLKSSDSIPRRSKSEKQTDNKDPLFQNTARAVTGCPDHGAGSPVPAALRRITQASRLRDLGASWSGGAYFPPLPELRKEVTTPSRFPQVPREPGHLLSEERGHFNALGSHQSALT